MAAFDGGNIFGYALEVITAENPRATQENAFAGISGIQSLDLGSRGRQTSIKGLLIQDSPAGLAAAENLIRSYNDGRTYTFTDNYGNDWAYVKLTRFQPTGKVHRAPGGFYTRYYEVTLHHLI